MYLRALVGFEKAWGPNHKSTLDTRFSLAKLFEEKLMLEDAEKHFDLVVQCYTKLVEPEHPETVKASERLKAVRTTTAVGQVEMDGDHDDKDVSSEGGGGGNDVDEHSDGGDRKTISSGSREGDHSLSGHRTEISDP